MCIETNDIEKNNFFIEEDLLKIKQIISYTENLSEKEIDIIGQELSIFEELFNNKKEVSYEELISVISGIEKIYDNGHELLNRVHEISQNKHLLGSLLGGFTFVDTLEKNDLFSKESSSKLFTPPQLAPSFYVARYLHKGFPLSFLYSMHRGGVPGIVTEKYDFNNSLNRQLGTSISHCVGDALYDKKFNNSENTFYCLIGDGEFQEGIAKEAIDLIYEHKLKVNIILNKNGTGLGKIKTGNEEYKKYFESKEFETADISGESSEEIISIIKEIEANKDKLYAIILNTKKGIHINDKRSHKPQKEENTVLSATLVSTYLETLLEDTDHIILCPDVMERYGFSSKQALNIGLRESVGMGMFANMPDDVKKIIASDDQFFMYSMAMLEQNILSKVKNLLIIAAKHWDVWGNSNYFVNTALSFSEDLRFFEPNSEEELFAMLEHHKNTDDNLLLSIFNTEFAEKNNFQNEFFTLNKVKNTEEQRDSAVVFYGNAGKYINEFMEERPNMDIFYVNSFPLKEKEIEQLENYKNIHFIEFNRTTNGIGANIAKDITTAKVHLIGADKPFVFDVTGKQISNQELDITSLLEKIV